MNVNELSRKFRSQIDSEIRAAIPIGKNHPIDSAHRQIHGSARSKADLLAFAKIGIGNSAQPLSQKNHSRVFADEVTNGSSGWKEPNSQLSKSGATGTWFDKPRRYYVEPWSDLNCFSYLCDGGASRDRIEIDLEVERTSTLLIDTAT